jgi:hypothetical protein
MRNWVDDDDDFDVSIDDDVNRTGAPVNVENAKVVVLMVIIATQRRRMVVIKLFMAEE